MNTECTSISLINAFNAISKTKIYDHRWLNNKKMVKEHIPGEMEKNMLGIGKMIKEQGKEQNITQMEEKINTYGEFGLFKDFATN